MNGGRVYVSIPDLLALLAASAIESLRKWVQS